MAYPHKQQVDFNPYLLKTINRSDQDTINSINDKDHEIRNFSM